MRSARLIVAVIFSFISLLGIGQTDIWYVGDDIKMDFSGGGDPVITDDGIVISVGGNYAENSTSITDENGLLLLYTSQREIMTS